MVKKYTLKEILLFVVFLLFVVLFFTAEFALFAHWDCESECKKAEAKKNTDFINKDDCSHITQDVWICNVRETTNQKNT